MIISIIKELLESILRNSRLMQVKKKMQIIDIVSNLKRDGISIEENFYTKEQCAVFRCRIDEMIDAKGINVWCDNESSDHRIYFINEVDELFNQFYEHPKVRDVLGAFVGTKKPEGMLLAAKIEYKKNNQGSGGGWHRDSPFTHQFKAICYLNDVTDDNGPFQYIKSSQNKINIISSYFKKLFKPGQYRFTDGEISNYLAKTNQDVTTVTGEQGSLVFADTKGIHRGKPLNSGCRYVLFCYFWHNDIPEHFNELRQNK